MWTSELEGPLKFDTYSVPGPIELKHEEGT
jgi:hypothetical protein